LAVEVAAGFVRHLWLGAKKLKMVDGQTAVVTQEDRRDSAVIVGKRFAELA
jgi:hypothetical protein